MQAVILAAGRGKRMGELTGSVPKPLVRAGGKTLIEYKLDALPKEVDHVIIVVGYLENMIRDHLGDTYDERRVSYAVQKDLNGTAGALHAAKDLLGERFLVMMGDDIYATEDIEECLRHDWAICAKKVKDVDRGGEILLDANGHLLGMHEARHHISSGYINTGLYMIRHSFFDHPMVRVENTTEFGIPHTLVSCARETNITVVISKHPWIQITDTNDLAQFERTLKRR